MALVTVGLGSDSHRQKIASPVTYEPQKGLQKRADSGS